MNCFGLLICEDDCLFMDFHRGRSTFDCFSFCRNEMYDVFILMAHLVSRDGSNDTLLSSPFSRFSDLFVIEVKLL
jgi:hypothetical protein